MLLWQSHTAATRAELVQETLQDTVCCQVRKVLDSPDASKEVDEEADNVQELS